MCSTERELHRDTAWKREIKKAIEDSSRAVFSWSKSARGRS